MSFVYMRMIFITSVVVRNEYFLHEGINDGAMEDMNTPFKNERITLFVMKFLYNSICGSIRNYKWKMFLAAVLGFLKFKFKIKVILNETKCGITWSTTMCCKIGDGFE